MLFWIFYQEMSLTSYYSVTIQTIYGYNYLRFLGQYVVNNQTPPTFYQSGTTQQFNLSVLQDPANDYFVLNHDARDLIVENKREILDKALASVAVPYPTFIIPGSTANEEQNRYAIGYKLTKENQVYSCEESLSRRRLTVGFLFHTKNPKRFLKILKNLCWIFSSILQRYLMERTRKLFSIDS